MLTSMHFPVTGIHLTTALTFEFLEVAEVPIWINVSLSEVVPCDDVMPVPVRSRRADS